MYLVFLYMLFKLNKSIENLPFKAKHSHKHVSNLHLNFQSIVINTSIFNAFVLCIVGLREALGYKYVTLVVIIFIDDIRL